METINVRISKQAAIKQLEEKLSKDKVFRAWVIDALEDSGNLDFMLEAVYAGIPSSKWAIGTSLLYDDKDIVELIGFKEAAKWSQYVILHNGEEKVVSEYNLTIPSF